MDGGLSTGRGPMRVGEIIDAAIKLYRSQALNLWKIVLVVIVPIAVINELIFYSTLPSGVFAYHGTLYVFNLASYSPSALAVIVPIVLGVIAPVLALGALCKCLLDAYTGRPTSWSHSLGFAASRLGSLIWLSILVSVLVIIGFILLIIPGIWLLVGCSVAVPVLMFEGIGGPGAIRRSMGLVKGRWWATFGALLVGIVLVVIAEIVLGLVIHAIESGLHVNSVGLVLIFRGLTLILSALITYPFYAAISVAIYIDLRVRKEALDLELMADSFTAGSRPAPPSNPESVPPPTR